MNGTITIDEAVDLGNYKGFVLEVILEHPGWDSSVIANHVFRRISTGLANELARGRLRDVAEDLMRSRARKTEDRATAKRQPPSAEGALGALAKKRQDIGHVSYTHNASVRKACKECGCDQCVAALEARAAKEAEWEKEYQDQLGAAVKVLTASLSRQIRLELTEELLATEFALGDGSKVTWGSASVEDHRRRIDLLEKNIAGNADTAAKHRVAIEMIESGSASSLGGLGTAA